MMTAPAPGNDGGSPRQSARPPRWLPAALAMVVAAALIGIAVYHTISALAPIVTVVVVAWFIALAFEPPVVWLVKRGMKRALATGLVMLALIAVIAGGAATFGGMLYDQARNFITDAPHLYATVQSFVADKIGWSLPEMTELGRMASTSLGEETTRSVVGTAGSLIGGVFLGTASLVIVYYMVAYGPAFRGAVCRVLAPKRQREVLTMWETAQEKVGGFINSRLVLAALCTVATLIFLLAVKVPYALPLALFLGVISQFVPTVGTWIGGVLPIIVALTVSPATAVGTAVFVVAYQQVENLILAPKVAATSLRLNPAIAFVSVLAAAAVFGPLGAMLALPVVATIQAVAGTYISAHDPVSHPLLDDAHHRGRRSRASAAAAPMPETDEPGP